MTPSSTTPEDNLDGQSVNSTDRSHSRSHSLDAWIDGDLDVDRKMQVAAWLANDRALTVELMGLEDLARRSARLSRHTEPAIDLWPAIAQRLEEDEAIDTRDLAEVTSPTLRDRVGHSRSTTRLSGHRAWWTPALAALMGVAAGAWLMTGLEASPPALVDGEIRVDYVATPLDPAVEPAADEVLGADTVETGFLKAREGLWLQLLAQRDALPPETWEAVVENLAILDAAIRDLRQGLDQDPGNPRLERMLVDNHQRSLDLLHRLARSA